MLECTCKLSFGEHECKHIDSLPEDVCSMHMPERLLNESNDFIYAICTHKRRFISKIRFELTKKRAGWKLPSHEVLVKTRMYNKHNMLMGSMEIFL